MTNEQLHELAATGVTLRIQAMEAELATYHKEWPELFRTAPTLLTRLLNSWTPERRAEHARPIRRAKRTQKTARRTRRPMSAAVKRKLSLAMKRRHASGEMARARAKAAKKRGAANG